MSKNRSHVITEDEIIGTPGLVVEMISKGTEEGERGHKKTLNARHEVKKYWLVDSEVKMIDVLTLGDRGFEIVKAYKNIEIFESPLLEDLKIDRKKIF